MQPRAERARARRELEKKATDANRARITFSVEIMQSAGAAAGSPRHAQVQAPAAAA